MRFGTIFGLVLTCCLVGRRREGEHGDDERQDENDANSLYDTLEKDVIPLFYDRDEQSLPRKWIERQKHAIRSLGRKTTAQRMVVDYTQNCYLPAADGVLCQFPEGPSVRLEKSYDRY